MSPIFNHHALHGLPTNALEQLRETFRQFLGQESLSEQSRINLHAALASVEAILRKRQARVRAARARKGVQVLMAGGKTPFLL